MLKSTLCLRQSQTTIVESSYSSCHLGLQRRLWRQRSSSLSCSGSRWTPYACSSWCACLWSCLPLPSAWDSSTHCWKAFAISTSSSPSKHVSRRLCLWSGMLANGSACLIRGHELSHVFACSTTATSTSCFESWSILSSSLHLSYVLSSIGSWTDSIQVSAALSLAASSLIVLDLTPWRRVHPWQPCHLGHIVRILPCTRMCHLALALVSQGFRTLRVEQVTLCQYLLLMTICLDFRPDGAGLSGWMRFQISGDWRDLTFSEDAERPWTSPGSFGIDRGLCDAWLAWPWAVHRWRSSTQCWGHGCLFQGTLWCRRLTHERCAGNLKRVMPWSWGVRLRGTSCCYSLSPLGSTSSTQAWMLSVWDPSSLLRSCSSLCRLIVDLDSTPLCLQFSLLTSSHVWCRWMRLFASV